MNKLFESVNDVLSTSIKAPFFIYKVFLDALFPISKTEQWLIDSDVEMIIKSLPRAGRTPIAEGCSIFSYKDERVWQLVWSIKYKKSLKGASIAGFALHKYLMVFAKILPTIILLPMPISKARRRERGFNQCELITDEIRKLDNDKQFIIIDNFLIRNKHTSRQTLKNKEGRIENAHDLFGVDQSVCSKLISYDTHIFIIDDVITTGSTIKEAIDTIKRAGFKNVYGISLAH